MWTLRTAVVLSVGLLDPSCLFTVRVACPFLSRFFGCSLSFSPGGHGWTMLTSYVDTFWNFNV